MVSRAFLDTTVVVDAALKGISLKRATRAAVKRFDERLVPLYAIQEFKSGPLAYYVWFHNRLSTAKTIAEMASVLQVISRTQQRYRTSTALSALEAAAGRFGHLFMSDLREKYGTKASLDSMVVDLVRLNVKQMIYSGWKNRNVLATKVVNRTECWVEAGPKEKQGLIDLTPRNCSRDVVCGLSEAIRSDESALRSLEVVAASEASKKAENSKRARVLRDLVRKPRAPILAQQCRALGDAMFVLLAPSDATILTTNTRDYEPLAHACGKRVERPIPELAPPDKETPA